MSKKIDAARKELSKALKKHAEVVGGNAVSLKQTQRTTARLQRAAAAYADVVQAKSGTGNPFSNVDELMLEPSTIDSLKAERDALRIARKKS